MSVVIPTYERPEWLRRAVLSLAAQEPLPAEVILVARDTDGPTHEAIRALHAERLPFAIRAGEVTTPGFMPPVEEGFRLATGEVVAVLDDDAETDPGWTAGLLRAFEDPRVGAAGGRYVNMDGDQMRAVEETDRVGVVTWSGEFVGNLYKRPTFREPRDVSFLLGGCMSYRRDVARALEFDAELNRNVAFGYEVDLGLQVKRMGWRVVFDPAVTVRHYSAPRKQSGMRDPNDGEAVYWSAFNDTRVAIRRLSPWHAAIALAVKVLVGTRRAPGLVPWLLGPLSRRAGFVVGVGKRATAGRVAAVRSVF